MYTTKQKKPPQKWLPEEDKLLTEAVGMYGTKNWSQVADHVRSRTAHQCYIRWTRSLNPDIKKRSFSGEEDKSLIEAVGIYGTRNWTEVSKHVPGRTAHQCLERWTQSLNPDRKKGPFSGEEDKLLIEAVGIYGTRNWIEVSKHVPGRTAKQCRVRWVQSLDPNLSKEPFTSKEDQIIIEKYKEYGAQWAKIAKHLPGRTDVQVRYRFNSRLKKRLMGENSKMGKFKNGFNGKSSSKTSNTPQGLQQDVAQQDVARRPVPFSIPQIIQPVPQPAELSVQNDNATLLKNLSEAADILASLDVYNLLNR